MIACLSEAFYQQNKHGVLGLHGKCGGGLLNDARCQFLVPLRGLIPPAASRLLRALLVCGAKRVGATAAPGGCGVLLCLRSVTIRQGCLFRLGALASSGVGAVLVPSGLGAARGGSGAVAGPSVGLSPPRCLHPSEAPARSQVAQTHREPPALVAGAIDAAAAEPVLVGVQRRRMLPRQVSRAAAACAALSQLLPPPFPLLSSRLAGASCLPLRARELPQCKWVGPAGAGAAGAQG